MAPVVGHRCFGHPYLQLLPFENPVAVPNAILGNEFRDCGAIAERDANKGVPSSNRVRDIVGLGLADNWLKGR